jgi:hypothetical protein
MREETHHEGPTVPIRTIHPYLLADQLAPTIPGQREDFGFAFPIMRCILLSLCRRESCGWCGIFHGDENQVDVYGPCQCWIVDVSNSQ